MRQHFGSMPARLAPWFRYVLIWRRLGAPGLSILSFAVLIAIGTAGLVFVDGFHAAKPLGVIDSLFMITSAVCVTGLSVIDPGTQFTFAGELWLIVFTQLGGIGIVALGTMLIGAMGARLSLRSEMLTMMPTRATDKPEIWQIAMSVLKFSLIVEGLGALVLFVCWSFEHPLDKALWYAVFHSISGYCNAGFSLFPDNLIGESNVVLVTCSLLIIFGGVGYLAFEELARWWKHSRARRTNGRIRLAGSHRLSTHTWSVVVMTVLLLMAGWILLAIFEWNGVLADMPLDEKLANSWFMSVVPRTGGFNAIDYEHVGNDSAALTIMLMFVGGSPGSTAGGVKTTTIAVLVALGISRIRGHKFVALKDRAIPEGTIERAVGVILLALVVLATAFFALNAIQSIGMTSERSRDEFLPVMFECVSAFSNTGISMNYSPKLHPGGELVVIWLMFVGRVGLLSFFAAAVMRRGKLATVRPAQEDVIVG